MKQLQCGTPPPDSGERCSGAETRLIERLHLEQCCAPEDFLREHQVGPYTLRLYCPAAGVALEIEDCEPRVAHPAPERSDAGALRRGARDEFLRSVGIEVVRVTKGEIDATSELEALVMRIARQIERRMRAQRESAERRRRVLAQAAREFSSGSGSSVA